MHYSDLAQKDAGVGPSFPLLPQVFPERTFSFLPQRSHDTTRLGEPSVTANETLSLSLTHMNCYCLDENILGKEDGNDPGGKGRQKHTFRTDSGHTALRNQTQGSFSSV